MMFEFINTQVVWDYFADTAFLLKVNKTLYILILKVLAHALLEDSKPGKQVNKKLNREGSEK